MNELKPNDLKSSAGARDVQESRSSPGARQFPFPTDPAQIRFNRSIADKFSRDGGDRQELEINSGRAGDGARAEGTCVFYVRHNRRIGRDQYSVKWGYGGDGGEYEHITQLGGEGGGQNRAGWRWEERHKEYTPSGDPPTHVNNEFGMPERVERGLASGYGGRQQGFMIIKTRSPNNDATVYDVYVDDMDNQGWKYAFSNRFDDRDNSGGRRRRALDCCNQAGRRSYTDRDMRIEVRFQDQNDDLDWPAADFRPGRPNGYISPLFSNA